MRKFTKFCGITNINDAIDAQESGCDAMGFVFVEKSKRYITKDQFEKIVEAISPMIQKVGLFSDNTDEEVQRIVQTQHLNLLQFHGFESNEFCKNWGLPFWKAVPMIDISDLEEFIGQYPDANGFVLDNYSKSSMAGSGEKFDWNKLPKTKNYNWILAGGLNVKNLAKAVSITGLNHYDVSSGIESSPGKKSKEKMVQFIKNLNQ